MDIKKMKQIETAVHVLRGLIKDMEDDWDDRAHKCAHYLDDTDGLDCAHSDPGFDPVCMPGNCPLTK